MARQIQEIIHDRSGRRWLPIPQRSCEGPWPVATAGPICDLSIRYLQQLHAAVTRSLGPDAAGQRIRRKQEWNVSFLEALMANTTTIRHDYPQVLPSSMGQGGTYARPVRRPTRPPEKLPAFWPDPHSPDTLLDLSAAS